MAIAAGHSHEMDQGEIEDKEALLDYLESQEFSQVSTNTTRLVAKLKVAVQKQELYEAHQILRTIYFRFANHKEKLNALVELLHYGALYLLSSQEFISGQDIATLVLEIGSKCLESKLEEGGAQAKSDLIDSSMISHTDKKTLDISICRKVSQLAIELPNNEVGQKKFVAEALKILHPKLLNRDLLHHVLASKFCSKGNYVDARYHYLHCANLENAYDITNMLIEYHCSSASKCEVDLFVTQFILQLLCLQCPLDQPKISNQNPRRTNPVTPPNVTVSQKSRRTIKAIVESIFITYTTRHPDIRHAKIPFSLPLLNFTYFIISILDSNQPESLTYEVLCDTYKTVSERRDPNYVCYLSRIGSIYFGIVDRAKQQQQQQQQQQGGLFNNILMSLLDSTGDGDENSNHGGNNLSPGDELD